MKIAIVCENYPPDSGGIATSARRLVLSLSSVIDIHVICFPQGNPNQPYSHSIRRESERIFIHKIKPFVNGWTIPHNPRLRSMILHQTTKQLVSIFSNEKIDIVHGFGLQNGGLIASRASLMLKLPLIQSIRGNDVGRNAFDGVRRQSLAIALKNSKMIVTVNHWLANLLKANFPWVKNRVRVINNAIDTNVYIDNDLKKELVSSLKIPQDGPIIGFVGTLREKKGPYLFSVLVRDFISSYNGRLIIIGDIDLDLFHEVGWSGELQNKNFVITKKARDKTELYTLISLCDWLVFPSLDDGMANGLLEAMICARPVICSTIFTDILKNWEDGIIASPLNPSAYLSFCKILWKNSCLRQKLGKAAQKNIEQNFSITKEFNAWFNLYKQIKEY
jgi:glycosyltransferase involved in cell wall biosynthesis